jgi:hypothetical protein
MIAFGEWSITPFAIFILMILSSVNTFITQYGSVKAKTLGQSQVFERTAKYAFAQRLVREGRKEKQERLN